MAGAHGGQGQEPRQHGARGGQRVGGDPYLGDGGPTPLFQVSKIL